ncbi:hypothetical protein [Aeromicrobium sp.]|uniref:hypothetical protein n=1 Tax=Aeromicrobium sp. TaxID=1871063 RepID=UPI0030BC89BC
MSTTPRRAAWSSTYRVSSESRQQRILRAIRRLDHPGITALGFVHDRDLVVVIDCASAAAEVRSRRIVLSLDLMAERLETTRASKDSGDDPPLSAHPPGLAIPRRLLNLSPADRLRKL